MQNLKEQHGYIPNSVEATIECLQSVRTQIAELKKVEDDLKEQLLTDFEDKIKSSLREKEEPFGAVNFQEGEYKITFTTPKKVEYDQLGLQSLLADGAPVTVEYTVNENVYKALDSDGKAAFRKYRTVEPGSISIKVERK